MVQGQLPVHALGLEFDSGPGGISVSEDTQQVRPARASGPAVFPLTALTSLLLLNYIAKNIGNLVGKGLPWSVIAEFVGLSVPFTFAMTLPMAVLVAVLYAFSRLAAENEITAIKASGVGLCRLLIPVMIAASFLSLFMIGFNDQVLPRSNHRLRSLDGGHRTQEADVRAARAGD